jgi:LAS superfamily LD-carboxypeptidase LdcB
MLWFSSKSQAFTALSFLILTWMSLVFFLSALDFYTYQEKVAYASVYQANIDYLRVTRSCDDFSCYTYQDYIDFFDMQVPPSTNEYPKIFNDNNLNAQAISFIKEAGYQPRSFIDPDELVLFDNQYITPEVQQSYVALRNAMEQFGIQLHLVSGYRSFERQQELFMARFGYDESELSYPLRGDQLRSFQETLAITAPPGYSKHHTGYAIDFACGEDYEVFNFNNTPCYQWMKQDNFKNVAMYGFLPSYPEGVSGQGPQPEAWEYVWVGTDFFMN